MTLADEALGRVEPERIAAAREAALQLSARPVELAGPSLPAFGAPRAVLITAEAAARHHAETAAAQAQLAAGAAHARADVRAARARLDDLGAALRGHRRGRRARDPRRCRRGRRAGTSSRTRTRSCGRPAG